MKQLLTKFLKDKTFRNVSTIQNLFYFTVNIFLFHKYKYTNIIQEICETPCN